jgi:hypothetical protein
MKLTSRYFKQFIISNPTTGVPEDATSAVVAVYKNNEVVSDATFDTTVASLGGGLYSVSSTNSFGTNAVFAEGDKVEIIVTAVISTATYSAVIDSFEIDSDKTGYKLAVDGLDAIPMTPPTGVATNFREMLVQVWRRFFKKVVKNDTLLTIETYDDANPQVVITTQTISDVSNVQTVSDASTPV